jgi:hypothetical protein
MKSIALLIENSRNGCYHYHQEMKKKPGDKPPTTERLTPDFKLDGLYTHMTICYRTHKQEEQNDLEYFKSVVTLAVLLCYFRKIGKHAGEIVGCDMFGTSSRRARSSGPSRPGGPSKNIPVKLISLDQEWKKIIDLHDEENGDDENADCKAGNRTFHLSDKELKLPYNGSVEFKDYQLKLVGPYDPYFSVNLVERTFAFSYLKPGTFFGPRVVPENGILIVPINEIATFG